MISNGPPGRRLGSEARRLVYILHYAQHLLHLHTQYAWAVPGCQVKLLKLTVRQHPDTHVIGIRPLAFPYAAHVVWQASGFDLVPDRQFPGGVLPLLV